MNKSTSYLVSFALFSVSLLVSSGARAATDGVYGSGSPQSSKSLPAGDFRTSLEALSSEDRDRAVQWLQSIEFTSQDLDYMKLDSQGGIFYADRFIAGKSGKTGAAKSTYAKPLMAASVLKLHSNPGAPKTIFVDFTGGVISNTAWNRTAGVSAWNAGPYDLDNRPGAFSANEIAAMAEIWQRISEDFSPFNVDVTTEAPRSVEVNTNWIMVTHSMVGNRQALPQPDSDSVSYMNVSGFSHTGYYSPALVYYNNLPDAASVAEAASHAAGHLYGLSHDSMPDASGRDSVAWSPIMGVGPSSRVTRWSKGDYSGAINPQNDIGILIGSLDLRRDDHDDSRFDRGTVLKADAHGRVTASTPATDPENKYSANKGVIEAQDDLDVFVFESGDGMVDITISPVSFIAAEGNSPGANLDVQAVLFNTDGKRLIRSTPHDGTNSNIRTHVSAGRYVLEVSGTGDAASSGSLGQYFINGTLPVPGAVSSVTVSAR